MPARLLVSAALLAWLLTGHAQDRIYRCGNEYTNSVPESKKDSCKLIPISNVTVIPAQRPPASAVRPANGQGAPAAPRIDTPEQKARDHDARLILEAEMRKTELRREELLKEYNNGAPEKLGPETRNHQKYLDRVAEMKAAIERLDSDLASLRRELARLTPGSK